MADDTKVTPEDAFDLLRVFIDEAREEIITQSSELLRSRKSAQAQTLIEHANELEKLERELEEIKDKFISLLDRAYASTTNVEINTKPRKRANRHLERGKRTPEKAYFVPILESLVELGGGEEVDDVLRIVHKKMRPIFNSCDLSKLPSGKDYRWRNAARWARDKLRGSGLISDASPRGIWEITDAGRSWLRTNQR